MAHRTRQLPAIPSNALVASAIRYSGKAPRIYQTGQDWQRECYRHYAICGEARYAARFYGHALSRVKLGIGTRSETGFEPSTSGEGVAQLNALFNGRLGQAQMLEAIGIHLAIAGECYLVGRTVKGSAYEQDGEIWEILSVLEVDVQGEKWSIKYDDTTPKIPLADDDVVIRIWMPDPAKRMYADSPFRSLIAILREIEYLTMSIFAQASSRLVGAGMLVLSDNMTFPPPPDKDGKAQEFKNQADGFMLTLADLMMKAIQDPSSPASKVPLIAMAPADAIDKIKLIQFWTEMDAQSMPMRNEAIRRFALGMDLPPEQVLGMSSNLGTGGGQSNGVSHWGAWQIEESTIKMHIEPMLETITNSLTIAYLRPLVSTDEEITYDTSALRLRPDRSKESLELRDRGLLKDAVAVKENGFNETDMPTDEEYRTFLLRKLATGSATPEQVQAALVMLGVELPVEIAPAPQPPQLEQPRETRPDPSLEDHPSKPRTPAESALVAACDGMVWRALEKAGNRVINSGVRGKNRDKSVEPAEFYLAEPVNGGGAKLLEGAFSYAPKILSGIGDAERLTHLLHNYCLALFQTQTPHSKEALAHYLAINGYVEGFNTGQGQTQPINLNVNVEGSSTPIHVTVPETQVHMASPPDVTVNVPVPEVKVEMAPTNVSVEPTPVQINNNVEPTPVNITNEVQTPEVNVTNEVQTPEVNVNPKITADVKIPKRKTTREVLRDEEGLIAGSIETEEEL